MLDILNTSDDGVSAFVLLLLLL